MYDQYDLIKSINEMPPKIPKKLNNNDKEAIKKISNDGIEQIGMTKFCFKTITDPIIITPKRTAKGCVSEGKNTKPT